MEKNSSKRVLMMADVFERVRKVIAEELNIPESTIHPSSTISGLSADSLEVVAVQVALEVDFRADLDRLTRASTVEDVVKELIAQ